MNDVKAFLEEHWSAFVGYFTDRGMSEEEAEAEAERQMGELEEHCE